MPPTLANGKVCYIEVPAVDVRRSADFYAKVFGWRIRQRGDGHTARWWQRKMPAGRNMTRLEGGIMKRSHLALTVAVAAGICAMTLAGDDAPDKGKPKVKALSEREIAEKVDGKKAKATTVEVTLEPGQASAPHRHPGPVFGYVIEGEYEWAIDDQPVKTLKAGDTFYEPTNCLHRVSKNPSDKTKARVLAVVLHPHDVKDIAVPEKPAKKE